MSIISIEEYSENLEAYRSNLEVFLEEIRASVGLYEVVGRLSSKDAEMILKHQKQSILRMREDSLELEDYLSYLDDVDIKGLYPTYLELMDDMCPLSYQHADEEFRVFMTRCLPCHRSW